MLEVIQYSWPNIKKSKDKPEAVDFQGFHNKQDKIRDILILSHSFQERFPGLQADIQEVLDCCTVELTEDNLGKMTGCSEPDDEDPGAVVQRPRVITKDQKKDQFMDMCLKFKHEMKAVMAPHEEVCKDM